MNRQTLTVILVLGLIVFTDMFNIWFSEARIKAHIDAELQTLAPVMASGRCYIIKMPEKGI